MYRTNTRIYSFVGRDEVAATIPDAPAPWSSLSSSVCALIYASVRRLNDTYPDAAFARELNDVLVVSLLFEFTERPDPASFDDVM